MINKLNTHINSVSVLSQIKSRIQTLS